MHTEKEIYLKQYYLLSEAMLEALVHGREEEIFSLLEQRDTCIAAIDSLNQANGDNPIMNDQIKQQLEVQFLLEKKIKQELQIYMKKLNRQVQAGKHETYQTKQYEDTISYSKGVFYDTKS
jgi:hypothetical protein